VLRKHAYSLSVAFILVFAVWLRWPTLHNGFFSDDVVAIAMADHVYAAPRRALDLFDFSDGTPSDHQQLMAYGSLPWWTVDGLRLAMLRPLASVLTLADYHLFGTDALPCHVHSLFWWFLLLLATASLYRELFNDRLALLALFLFTLKEGHTFVLGWLANRGALVAMLCCVLALRAHLRWRCTRDLRMAFWSAGLFSLALLSGEWALPLMAYVLAFELLRSDATWRERALGLLPSAIPTLAFGAVRAALGYGAHNSGVYTDPVSEPLRFVLMIFTRIPVFFADLVFAVPSVYWGFGTPWRDQLLSSGWIPVDLWLRLPAWTFWHVLIGVVAIVAVVLALWRILPTRAPAERSALHWLLLGGAISLLPMVASFTHSRVLIPAALAFAPASASVLEWCWEALHDPRRRARHALLLPLCLGVGVLYMQVWRAGTRSWNEAAGGPNHFGSILKLITDAEVDWKQAEHKRVVLLGTADHTAMVFAPYVLWASGEPMPRSWWTLSAAPYAFELYRPAPNVLELSTLGGPLLRSEMEALYRADRFRMRVGERVQLPGLQIEILRLEEGFPQTVRFTFERDVEDPSYLFLYPSPEGLGPARLPEIGERLLFRKPSFGDQRLQKALREAREPNVKCLGAPPPINQCRSGFAFSDCGGGGSLPPVLGCVWRNDCRWFLHGCVAEEYAPSACPASNICCEQNWPYDGESFTRMLPYARRLQDTLRAWGRRGLDVERDMLVEVSIEPTLRVAAPEVRCTGPRGAGGPCGLSLVDLGDANANSLYFAFHGSQPAQGWSLTVEMIEDRAGQMQARICRVATPPLAASEPPARECAVEQTPECVTRGRLTLNLFPVPLGLLGAVHAKLSGDFPDGLHVEAEF
jgi:hypothetical protein